MYLATRGLVATPPALVGLFAFMMGQGSSLGYTVALNTSVKNFEAKDRGTVRIPFACDVSLKIVDTGFSFISYFSIYYLTICDVGQDCYLSCIGRSRALLSGVQKY